MKIPFNIPFTTGKELNYIQEAIESGHLSGNGPFTRKCQSFFEDRYGFNKCLLTTSCTDALEMAALLIDIKPDDEVIIPSFTFVSTALAFTRQGAVIKFVDSRSDHPGMNEIMVESMITDRTRAIVVVHYAGIACDMDIIMSIAKKYSLFVVEDSAHALNSYYKRRPLGSIGHFACFSFHETKSIHSGEGGMLVVNNERFSRRAEILWEKGTNRCEFHRGKADKYGWVDTGSSFLPSEITAAFLYAQLENIDQIQEQRIKIWNQYYKGLVNLSKSGHFALLHVPEYCTNNAHIFFLICRNRDERDGLIDYLKECKILSVFHFLCLHKSEYNKLTGVKSPHLPNALRYEERLIRLPFFVGLKDKNIDEIVSRIGEYYKH